MLRSRSVLLAGEAAVSVASRGEVFPKRAWGRRPMGSLCAETALFAPGARVPTLVERPGCRGEQMAVLPAGRWPLAAGAHALPNASPRQELVFVKLTDSALRAIEHYVANQVRLTDPRRVVVSGARACAPVSREAVDVSVAIGPPPAPRLLLTAARLSNRRHSDVNGRV